MQNNNNIQAPLMAVSPFSPATLEPMPETPEPEKPILQPNQPNPSPPAPAPAPSSSSSSSLSSPSPSSSSAAAATASASAFVAENPNPNPHLLPPPPPSAQSFAPAAISAGAIPPSAPSFRPVTPMHLQTPQFSPIQNHSMQNPNFQNPNIQNPNVQPPGVNPHSIMLPGVATGAGAVTVSVSPLPPNGMFQAVRPYAQMPNGYPGAPASAPQGMMPPPVS